MPSDDNLKDFYDNIYHKRRHLHLLKDEEYFCSRAKASAKLNLGKIPPDARVLEFGCGLGQNIVSVPAAFGFEVSHEALESCKQRNIPVFDNIEDIPKGTFDIVLCRHVLEHVPSPLETLRQIKTLLKLNGRLILILPKEKHYVPSSFEPDLNQHLFCWNFRTLNNLLYYAGYKIESNNYQYVVGYKKLLPIKRLFGFNAYYYATLLAGRVFRVGELVVHAIRNQ